MSTQKGYFLKRLCSGWRKVAIVRSSAISGVGMCYLPQQIILLNSILNSCFESLPSVHFVCHCNLALGALASSEVRTGPPNYVVYTMDVLFCDSFIYDILV